MHDLSQRSFFTVLVVIGRKEKDMVVTDAPFLSRAGGRLPAAQFFVCFVYRKVVFFGCFAILPLQKLCIIGTITF